jgi:hypothetical protein
VTSLQTQADSDTSRVFGTHIPILCASAFRAALINNIFCTEARDAATPVMRHLQNVAHGQPPQPCQDLDLDCGGIVSIVRCSTLLSSLGPNNSASGLTLADACPASCGLCGEGNIPEVDFCHDVLANCAETLGSLYSSCYAEASIYHDAISAKTTLAQLCPSFCAFGCGNDSCASANNGVCDYYDFPQCQAGEFHSPALVHSFAPRQAS